MNELNEIFKEILDDRSVPRNIRLKIEEAKEKLKEKSDTQLSEAIYILDDISNDVNMPAHIRTDIWQVISIIEEMKEKAK
jgi:uncharacterized protein